MTWFMHGGALLITIALVITAEVVAEVKHRRWRKENERALAAWRRWAEGDTTTESEDA